MIQASRTEEPNSDFQITNSSFPNPQPILPLLSAAWLRRARIISALVYIFLQIACFIFIIVCIVRFPRCQKASTTEWWMNGVILRFSNHTLKFNDLTRSLKEHKTRFNMHAIWFRPVFPLSNESNPLGWKGIDSSLGEEIDLINLTKRARDENIRIIIDYPLNHVSIQSKYFNFNESYFVWNEQGNTSNWMTTNDNETSAWTYDKQKNSFYLHQFDNNNDSIDINYRNNRVLNDIIDSVSYWNTKFHFDGYNLPGLSYAYEDYEYKNDTDNIQTRHLDEDYLLLARIRSEIDEKHILLFDSIDSLDTTDKKLLARYYGDQRKGLGGVQLASLNDYILPNETETNLTKLFESYYNSTFYKQKQLFVWSSLSSNAILNEAFFATCLFHTGTISIDQQGNRLLDNQLHRLRTIMSDTRKEDVFRDGKIKQTILPGSTLLTIERTRRGSKSYMIIVNFNDIDKNDKIVDNDKPKKAEMFLNNEKFCDNTSATVRSIELKDSICLKPYGYIIIRWLPPIESLSTIF
ncbi:unnamed protein product [Rotaria socialis]|uniref:Glycosyl hydrolase family 13 catalytic domain-containing protein n=1 Tax=Rotaria socialis TaxID=392032 RepID=A0A818IPE6_9BILA|nr:unnamed protein product [Rotaria socialis]CAF3527786.1 unnamed protein product [Rotaria socialis]CAF3594699.1 unnamed protein product [Rotaria socialis]CAF4242557.1 unnamed protein product [Rotaria socialis]CAF4481651.1 unnamed protein product [Rotaria socialis]